MLFRSSSNNTSSFAGIGTIGANYTGISQLTFTPNPNIDVEVRLFANTLRYQDDTRDILDFYNATIKTRSSRYFGTEKDIRRTFDLTYKTYPIFKKSFSGNNPTIVDINLDKIFVPNHFFVTGEQVTYSNPGTGTSTAIEIGRAHV